MMKGKTFLDAFVLFCRALFRDENFTLAKTDIFGEFSGFPAQGLHFCSVSKHN